MLESKIKEMEDEIMKVFREGGSHSHNVIQHSLMEIAKTNRPEAERIYAVLLKKGY